MKASVRAALAVVALLLCGCSTNVGVMPHGTATETRLERANFRVLRANARGVDTGFKLLGLIPVVSPSVADATDHLYEDIEVEGHAVSLVNVTQEHRSLYLILFSLPKIVVRADVIEFLPEPETKAEPKTADQ